MNKKLISPERTFSLVTMAATACAAVLVLAACGPGNGEPAKPVVAAAPVPATSLRPASLPVPVVAAAPVPRADLGRVSRVETITTPGETHGGGALIGGVVGAALGNQVGHGSGKAAATGLGAVGGAVLGNKIERDRKSATTSYRIHVRLDNGETRSFESASNDGLRVGDRVRVDGSLLRRA